MISILAGGRAERMGRGVKSVDCTKGLMMIPVYAANGDRETLIDRHLRLLQKVGAIEDPKDVLMCVGYKAEMVMERYPGCRFMKTYDPEDPCDVLPAFHQVLERYPNERQHTFIMGDSVWSEAALRHFLSVSAASPLVFYHGGKHIYGETFGLAVNGETGKGLVRAGNDCDSMPVVNGETRWHLAGVTRIPPRDCRTSCFEQWIDLEKLPGKMRVDHVAPVDDVDWDNDHERICAAIKRGEYGEA